MAKGDPCKHCGKPVDRQKGMQCARCARAHEVRSSTRGERKTMRRIVGMALASGYERKEAVRFASRGVCPCCKRPFA